MAAIPSLGGAERPARPAAARDARTSGGAAGTGGAIQPGASAIGGSPAPRRYPARQSPRRHHASNPGTPAVVLDDQEVSAILGKSVRSNAGEDMGRIVDVIVSGDGQVAPPSSTSAGSSASARARSPSTGARSISRPRASRARSRSSSPATRCGWRRNTSAASRWWWSVRRAANARCRRARPRRRSGSPVYRPGTTRYRR